MNYIDPAYRFTVVYKDDRQLSQEDDAGVVVRDHCHVEDWDNVKIYALTNRPKDHVVSVNWENGSFSINNTVIKVLLSDIDMFMYPEHREAVFKPIYGRRIFNGEGGRSTYYFLGWETELMVPTSSSDQSNPKMLKKKFRRVMYVSEHGHIFFES